MPSGVYDRDKPRKPRGSGRISRVAFLCDDLHVGDALRALVGIALEPPTVQPVVNIAQKPNGQLVAKSGGKRHEMLLAHIREHKLTEIKSNDVGGIMRELGLNASNTTSILRTLVQQGVLKRASGAAGKGGSGNSVLYHVVGE